MKITAAEFIMSNSDVSKCPKDAIPEYAFIGRGQIFANKYVGEW